MALYGIFAWRSFIAAFVIAYLVVYSWLGNIKFPGHGNLTQQQYLQPIAKKIWQIHFNHLRDPASHGSIATWRDMNPAYEHKILDDVMGIEIIRKHYDQDPDTQRTYLELRSTILRADYLRYLVLAAEGGIYSDIDTHAVKPIEKWYSDSTDRPVRALVGMEYDQLDNPVLTAGMYMPVQFCQWTLAISAYHPLMTSMVESVTQDLQQLARLKNVSLSHLSPTNPEVLFTTGPVQWSKTVYSYLSASTGTEVTHRNFTGLKEPKLVGNVMILPINAFASGLGHSGSSKQISNDTLMWHEFRSSWKSGELDRVLMSSPTEGEVTVHNDIL